MGTLHNKSKILHKDWKMWKTMGRKPSYFDSALTSTFARCFTIFIVLLGSFFIS